MSSFGADAGSSACCTTARSPTRRHLSGSVRVGLSGLGGDSVCLIALLVPMSTYAWQIMAT